MPSALRDCLALIGLLCLAAAPPALAADDPPQRMFDDIVESGTLRVGTALFVPWAMQDEDGGLFGYEIDVAEKLAADMGLEPEIRVYDWNKLLGALEAGEIDVIVAGMAITPERALRANFTQPYAESGVSLAANIERTKDVERLSDLNRPEVEIAVVSETVSERVAKQLFDKAKVRTFPNSAAAEKAVLSGDVGAYVESAPLPQFLALEHPQTIEVPLARPILPTLTGLAVRQGDPDLLAFMNAWITARAADTWLSSRHDYWFNSLRWRAEREQ